MALVVGILMTFGSDEMRWLWLVGGICAAIILFWAAGRAASKDD